MILYTFEEVKSDVNYIETAKETASRTARSYINSVVREVGVINLSQKMHKQCVIINGASYRTYDVSACIVLDKGVRSINDMDIDTLFPICEAIRQLRLVPESKEEEQEMAINKEDEKEETVQ